MIRIPLISGIVAALMAFAGFAQAQGAADLAKDLSNPISSLISLPFQFNYDEGYGSTGEGKRSFVNIQPVVPISLGDRWNLVSRTILPVISQSDFTPGSKESGIGDITQSFFFSPKAPTAGGLVWGVGPAFLFPTASDNLGSDTFAAGVTGVALKQTGPWTIGALANHLWSDGTSDTGIKVNSTFFQPFLSYTTPTAWTYTVNSETQYNWETEDAAVPINFTIAKVTKIGSNTVSIGGGVRYWADSAAGGPDGWGARFIVTFLYPK